MPTPKDGYRLKGGTPVPRTTEVIDAFDPKYGLRDWIWNQGKQGLPWREKRDSAGNVGTAVHAMIEAWIRRKPQPVLVGLDVTQKDQVGRGFMAFTKWVFENDIEWLETEIELVSEVFGYGGTLDAVGKIGEELILFDWKTSSGIYPSHLIQVAAYRNLWNENRVPRINRVFVVRFSKTDATFEPYEFSLVGAWSAFVHMRRAFDEMPFVKADLKETKACMKLRKLQLES